MTGVDVMRNSRGRWRQSLERLFGTGRRCADGQFKLVGSVPTGELLSQGLMKMEHLTPTASLRPFERRYL